MISSFPQSIRPVRPAVSSAPVQAGGGVEVTPDAQVRVTKDVLGFIPVTVSLDMGDILAGQYGKDFRVDFQNASQARVTGQAQYGMLPVPIDTTINLKSGGAMDNLAVHVNDDKTIALQGVMNFLGWKVPFACNVAPQRMSQGVFRFNVNSLSVGQGFQLPAVIGAWLATAAMSLGGMSGVKATDLNQFEVDFAQLRS